MKTNILRCASLAILNILIFFTYASYAGPGKTPIAHSKKITHHEPQILTVADRKPFSALIADDMSSSVSALTSDTVSTDKIVIYRRGASFIKVHFNYFSIPEGSEVVVRNPSGTQKHVYGSAHATAKTIDSAQGDDGSSQFSALSILGDSAIIEYKPNGSSDNYSVDIDYFMEGYPEEMIEEIIQGTPDGIVGSFSTCGVNERRDAQCWANSHPVEFERTRPVARLLINGSGLCTAWRVGPNNHMFTNNHCVESQADVAGTEVWFNYQRNSCGGGGLAQSTIVSGKTLLKTDYTLDYSLFSVNNFNSITSFGHYGLDVRDATLQEQIYIPQHGSGNPKELAIASDQNAGNVCRVDDNFTNGRGTNTDIGYYCDTIGGSSGSPVLAKGTHKVIALHHFGGCLNKGVRVKAIWPQVSSFFGGQVPSGDNGGGGGNTDTELVNGNPITGLSGATSSQQFFVMNVPSGASNVSVKTSGGSGDADLYVRVGSKPTTSTYDCRPYANGNNETCNLPAGSQGKVYVMVRAYSNFSGLRLTGSYQSGGSGGANSGSEESLSAAQGAWKHYRLNVPSGANTLVAKISGGNGDADLYTRFGQQPTTSDYSCRPYKNGSAETCTITNPNAGDWFISIRAYQAYSGLTLEWEYN